MQLFFGGPIELFDEKTAYAFLGVVVLTVGLFLYFVWKIARWIVRKNRT